MTHLYAHIRRAGAALTLLVSLSSICSCDDGAIEEHHQPTQGTNTYTLRFCANIKGVSSWNGQYSVALACFDSESEYAKTVKTLHDTDADEDRDTILLSGIGTDISTVEVAILSPLRKRIASIASFKISADISDSDTIVIDAGDIEADMFASINRFVFQGNNCSRCHSGLSPASDLNLSADVAYSNILNVPSVKSPSTLRVKPGDADNSYLYRIITDENIGSHYAHTGLFTDAPQQAFIDIIKSWINAGAK